MLVFFQMLIYIAYVVIFSFHSSTMYIGCVMETNLLVIRETSSFLM